MAEIVSIRRATAEDHLAVVRLFDAAMLETDPDRLGRQLDVRDGFVLLGATDDRPIGAIAVDFIPADPASVDTAPADHATKLVDDDTKPARITAIAVQRRRRDRGIGRQLVDAAADRVGPRPLTATFDKRVQSFYRACGFEIEPHEGRLWGCRQPTAAESESD